MLIWYNQIALLAACLALFWGAPHRSKVCKQALHYRVKLTDTGGWYSNMRVGEDCAAVKVTIDDQSDEILGAHLLGPNGAE